MALKAYWAYDFACGRSLANMLAHFNQAGPWTWEARESAWYGDYLRTRPTEGVRVRLHEYPQGGEAGTFVGRQKQGFSALLQIDGDSAASRAEIDEVLKRLLAGIGATELTEIEPYD